MKKKVYLIVSSVLSILLGIYTIVISKDIIDIVLDTAKQFYSFFPVDFQTRVIAILEKAGSPLISLFTVVGIICNIIIFIIAIKGNILKNKGTIIGLSVATMMTSLNEIVMLFALANIIVIALCKRVNLEDYPDKNGRELPNIKYGDITTKQRICASVLLLVYFSQLIIGRVFHFTSDTKLIVSIIFDIIMFILCIVLFYSKIKEGVILFKNNIIGYMRFIFPRLGIAYILFIIGNLIAIFVTKSGTSVNQTGLEALPKAYIIPIAIIWAPVVEEIIFRGSIRRFIKNDIAFIITSGLIFGVLHAISEASILNIVIISIPYSLLGCFLAYMYSKTNNICVNVFCHSIWNTIASIILIFI